MNKNREKLLEMFNAGMSNVEMAEVLCITPNAVGCRLTAMGLRRDKYRKSELAKLTELFNEGKTIIEIGKCLGISRNAVKRRIVYLGLERPRIEPDCLNCPYGDCIWNGESRYCPAQPEYYTKERLNYVPI